MLNREGYYVAEEERECTNCRCIFPRTSKTVTLCGPCNSTRVKTSASLEKKMWSRARDRSKKSGLEFSIAVEDISIPTFCPYLDILLEAYTGSSGGKPASPALDRINNEEGYTKNNIQVISHLANQMKASANREQLILFSKRVLETFGAELTSRI